MSSNNRQINLANDVPSEAIELLESKPAIREEFDTRSAADYDGQDGDLAELVEEASLDEQVVELGSGEYWMSDLSLGDGVSGVVGDGSDECIIHCDTGGDYLFDGNPDEFVMEGVRLEAEGDVAPANLQVGQEGWFEDILFRGKRNKYGADGARFTFLIEADEGATNLINNCRFPDGGTNHPDNDSVGHAIGPNADPNHEGLNVWKDVHCEGFMDNGFYVAYSPGQNILLNCTAINNGGANFRPGQNDTVIGGYSEASDLPDDRICKPLSFDSQGHAEIIGLEMYGEGSAVGGGGELIQIRADSGSISFDRTIAHANGVDSPLGRLDDVRINITDSYWLQEDTGVPAAQVGRRSADGDVHADDSWRLEATDAAEISGPVEIDGEYYDGETTAEEAGLDSPRPFPDIHFSEGDSGSGGGSPEPEPEPEPEDPQTGEFSVYAEDTETGERLNGVTVTIDAVGRDFTETGETSNISIANGGVMFGELPVGYYHITAKEEGYQTGTYDSELWRDEGEAENEAMYLDDQRRPIIYMTPKADSAPEPDPEPEPEEPEPEEPDQDQDQDQDDDQDGEASLDGIVRRMIRSEIRDVLEE